MATVFDQVWFPDLHEFSIDHPVVLPVTETLSTEPVGSQEVLHYQPQVLALTGWCLSGVLSGAKVFQQQQQQWSTSAARSRVPPLLFTMPTARSGISGAKDMGWIHCIPLFLR